MNHKRGHVSRKRTSHGRHSKHDDRPKKCTTGTVTEWKGVSAVVQARQSARVPDSALTASGVPAKTSTRENVHLTILRQRILIRRQNSPVKRTRENVHQPRIWTPNSLHFAHAVHFAHGRQNLMLSFDCRSERF